MAADFQPITIDTTPEGHRFAGGLRVTRGDRYIDGLGIDEASWVVAHLLLNLPAPYGGMKTAEQHADDERARQERLERRLGGGL